MLYLFTIMVVAFRLGRGPSLLAAGLSVAAYDFFFVPPFHTFSVEHAKYLLTFGMMFGVGWAISYLTDRLRRQEKDARTREERTAALYSFTRELATTQEETRAAEITARHAADVFGGEAIVFLRDGTGKLRAHGKSRAEDRLSEEEMAVARWVSDHGRPAGRGTDTLPGTKLTCVPLLTGTATLGVLALRLPAIEVLEAEDRNFLDAFVRQAVLSIERARLTEEAKAAALRARTEEMRSALLSAVSHDLRTPLATITGAGTALRDDRGKLGPAQHADLLEVICTEATRMERLIHNILDMVRLESGGIAPRREWIPLEEIVGSALGRMEEDLADREVKVELPESLPLVSVDPVLFEQVFVNLLDNAVKYTGAKSPIEVRALPKARELWIEVSDRGPGLPEGAESRVFEKFYRGPKARSGGAGLGLAICLGIVEAHTATLTAENREGGGATFRIRLPLLDAPPAMEPAEEALP